LQSLPFFSSESGCWSRLKTIIVFDVYWICIFKS